MMVTGLLTSAPDAARAADVVVTAVPMVVDPQPDLDAWEIRLGPPASFPVMANSMGAKEVSG